MPSRELQAEAEASQNRRALRKAEAAALAWLLAKLWELIQDAEKSGTSISATAQRLRIVFVSWILEIRRRARIAGRLRLAAEAAKFGEVVEQLIDETSEYYDRWRAERDAKSFAERWLKAATAAAVKAAVVAAGEEVAEPEDVEPEDAETPAGPMSAATAAVIGALTRMVVTENAQAFTDERNVAKQSLPEEFFREWDAKEDSHVCPFCYAMDRTVVRLHEPFPEGEPGDIHTGCRCVWLLRGPYRIG